MSEASIRRSERGLLNTIHHLQERDRLRKGIQDVLNDLQKRHGSASYCADVDAAERRLRALIAPTIADIPIAFDPSVPEDEIQVRHPDGRVDKFKVSE